MTPRGLAVACAAAAAGCAAPPVVFPRRDPLAVDPDRQPVAAVPRPYVSTYVWDKVDNTVFGPVSRALAVDVGGEAANATSVDEVADSAWFTNRVGRHRGGAALAAGACTAADKLPASAAVADGAWVITHGKDSGATPGFQVTVPGRGVYLFKADEPGQPERASAASAIGAALYHAAGFNTSCEQVVYVRRSQLALTPGLTTVDNYGHVRRFDAARLDRLLAAAPHRGDLVRLGASTWLPGYALGPFRYAGTRADDPNDVVPHQDRRELRGSRLLAAWINHWDAREENTLDTWIAADPARPRSAPGYVRHYLLDVSDALGQRGLPVALAVRRGRAYYVDVADALLDLVTLGAIRHGWDRAHVDPAHPRFGYFSAADFDPAGWKSGYPNPAFVRMTERDAAWMARIIARFTPADVAALVGAGALSSASDARYLTAILLARQRAILARYLARLSPLADVRAEPDGRLCAIDLARARGIYPAARFHYRADSARAVTVGAGGAVCVVPAAHRDPSRQAVIRIWNGTGAGPLEIYVDGTRVVGVRRPRR